MKICISGLTACGKSVIGKFLSKSLGFSYISFSDFLISEIKKVKPEIVPNVDKNDHYWYYAKKINKFRLKSKIDRQIDIIFKKKIDKSQNIVFDSFVYPIINRNKRTKTLHVLLKNSEQVRIIRALRSSSSLSKQQLIKYISEKDNITKKIIKDLWGINIFSKSYDILFDIIINSDILENPNIGGSPEDNIKQVSELIRAFFCYFVIVYYNKKRSEFCPKELINAGKIIIDNQKIIKKIDHKIYEAFYYEMGKRKKHNSRWFTRMFV